MVTPESVVNRDRGVRHDRRFTHFWPSNKDRDYVPLVFCNVVGEEEELVVTTEEGNQRSKSNQKEKDKVVSLRDIVPTAMFNLTLFSCYQFFKVS